MKRTIRFVLLLFVLEFTFLAAAHAQFKKIGPIFVTGQPDFATTADFNNDGIPDLAVALYFPYNFAVLLGAGDGTFPTRSFVRKTGFVNPGDLALGDFNEDGNADIVGITVGLDFYAGNGDGTFQLRSSSPFNGFGPQQMVVADFNHDGHLDIATANDGSQNISVLFGNGDGTFQPETDYPLVSGPLQLVAADLNNDGSPDLAFSITCSDSTCNHGEVGVLLNNQDGTFQPAVGYGAGVVPDGIAAGDLNHDGNIDIVATNSNFASVSTVSVFLGNGDGTLAPAVNYMVEKGPASVAIADLDGDGNPDLAVANAASNSVSLLRGNGDGTFQGARGFGVGLEPISVLASDLNGDGKPDLVFSLLYAAHISVFLNSR
ncbi:MAG TPA: VCBS repeat-containing protein [Terriglobales bacterium]|nr:VCBS repeat-containing protein [Terriglobales bacterium]